MKFKWITAGMLAVMMSVGMFSTTVSAFVDETAVEDATQQEVEQVEEPEPMQPLTPDGNLTLVDDEGDVPKAGKQFITVVTKTGNYFYLIIDRDDEGKETVHFLNQVDEADLLKLMDEEELEQLAPEKEQEPEPEPEPEPEVPQPEKEKKKTNPWPAILVMLGIAGGGGFFAYKKWQEKQAEKEQVKPDPDADYVDDDEEYDYNQDEEIDVDEMKDDTLV